MISSPSAQIVNAIAESNLITIADGKRVPSYGPTMGIATAIIAMGIVVTAALGPEKRGSHFENAIIGGDASATNQARVADFEKGHSVFSTEKPCGERDEAVEIVGKK